MPRDGTGQYTLPLPPVFPGDVIESNWANTTLNDIALALTDSLSRTGAGGLLVPFTVADGTVGAPGIAFTNEPTSGMYRAGLNDYRLAIAGQSALEITATAINMRKGLIVESGGAGTVRFGPIENYIFGNAAGLQLGTSSTTRLAIADTGPLTAFSSLTMSGNKITGLAAGTANGDALRYEQLVGQYLPLTGGSLAGPGDLNVAGNLIMNGGSGGRIYVGSDVNNRLFGDASIFQISTLTSRPLAFATNGTGRLQINADGLIRALSGQIEFPATQNPSSNPNTLDDYEEGTWTPTIAFGGLSTGITYVTQQGAYTKIGDRVFVTARVDLSNKGSATGTAVVGGLPFTVNGSYYATGSLWITAVASAIDAQIFGLFVPTSNNFQLYKLGHGTTGVSNVTNADFANTTAVMISGHYKVA